MCCLCVCLVLLVVTCCCNCFGIGLFFCLWHGAVAFLCDACLFVLLFVLLLCCVVLVVAVVVFLLFVCSCVGWVRFALFLLCLFPLFVVCWRSLLFL